MAYIYKITNDINDKIYIGKTNFSIEKRFKEHCLDAFRERNEKRPLYNAMKKYGIEQFHVELIEETNNPEEREIYWIQHFNSYQDGYNATMGGDGSQIYDHQKILEALKINPRPIEIAKLFGCCVDIVYDIAHQNNISIINRSQELLGKSRQKSIKQYSKQNEYIQTFNSTVDAGKWCFENKKCLELNSGVRSHIAECANGKRKSAYGYIWKYD